ncbi:MAG TPA: hypothetical protein PKI19_12505 [Elusimicrobiales bacterium]|nr:hypothetical protein [Elusimicrobiales bacterium]
MKNTGATGYIHLARPLAPGISRVTVNDPTFSDLAGVLTGAKPVTYTDCSPENIPALKQLCERLRLKCLPVEEFLSKSWHHFVPGKKVFFIGKRASTIKTAALDWKNPENNERWATLLGYPDCCIRLYTKWLKTQGRGPDLVKMSFDATRKTGRLDFRMNNVFNYSSRIICGTPGDDKKYQRFVEFNKEHNFPSKHIMGWHPCSYDCPKSLKKAAEIFSFMRHHAPDYAAELEELLARPVLFWDKYRYAFLKGSAAGGVVSCRGVAFPRSLLDIKTYRRISMCDTIRTGQSGTDFFRKGKLFYSLRSGAPALLNFGKEPGRGR